MADPIAASFRKPFAEQQAAFRLRLGNLIPTHAWDDIRHNAHDRGFMVAGAAKADLLADLGAAVDKAISEGTSLEEFRRDFRSIVAKHGWHGWTGEGTEAGEAWRTKVIYKTNLRTSYAAGRRAQLVAGEYRWWVYRHSGAEHPRLDHLSWNGIALAPDHPFWAQHYPPNGWGCGCEVYGARTDAGIRRVGGTPGKELPPGWNTRDPRTGLPPGISKGWDYAPGSTVSETVNTLKEKLPSLPATLGAAMFHDFPVSARRTLADEFAEFVDRSLAARVEKNYMIIGALKPEWVAAAKDRGISIESAEIAVTDKDVQHTFRGTGQVTAASTRTSTRQPKVDPLDLDWYKRLPDHLDRPQAVLLDQSGKEPVFLLVYDQGLGKAKLVIEIKTPIKKAKRTMNSMQSRRLVDITALKADIGNGASIIHGSL